MIEEDASQRNSEKKKERNCEEASITKEGAKLWWGKNELKRACSQTSG